MFIVENDKDGLICLGIKLIKLTPTELCSCVVCILEPEFPARFTKGLGNWDQKAMPSHLLHNLSYVVKFCCCLFPEPLSCSQGWLVQYCHSRDFLHPWISHTFCRANRPDMFWATWPQRQISIFTKYRQYQLLLQKVNIYIN